MMRRSALILITAISAGLLFVNIYTSMIDAVSWGSDMPTSLQTAREYFKVVSPGNFMRVFSPLNQILTLLALIICWKTDKKIRIYCAMALVIAIGVDVFTFAYFYPRLDVLFWHPSDNIETLKTAWSEWSNMNWVRSALVLANLTFDFAAFILLIRSEK